MNVILSEAKDLTVAMGFYRNQLKINEAEVIQRDLKAMSAGERSLAPLGMTTQRSEGPHSWNARLVRSIEDPRSEDDPG